MSRSQWKGAGALALGYVVLTLVAVSIGAKVPQLGARVADVTTDFTTHSQSSVLLAAYVGGLAVLAFLGLAAFLASVLRGWAGALVLATGGLYAVLFGLDPAMLAALAYAGHHGAEPAGLVLVDTIRNVVLIASYLALGAFMLSVAAVAWIASVLPRWLCYSGVVVGIVLLIPLVSAPAYLLSLVWMVAAGLTMLARRRESRTISAEPQVAYPLS